MDRFERFSLAIAQINRHWHLLTTEEMQPYGLRGSNCVYLLALARNPEGLSAPQLCQTCCKDKSDVSRMMKVMEEKGLLYKSGGHQNRYGGVYRLTEEGMTVAQHLRLRASQAVEYAGGELTEDQRTTFYDALDAIMARLGDMCREGIPEG